MNKLRHFTLPLFCGAMILLGAFLPVSVAMDNILLGILLLAAFFNLHAVVQILLYHPVARAAWLLFAVLILGIFYGTTSFDEATGVLGKYVDLAFVPLFMLLFSDDTTRNRSLYAFLIAMGVTLILSYCLGFHLMHRQSWMGYKASPDDYFVFHSHITHNNMMAFAILLVLLKMRDAVTVKMRFAWGGFALLAIINVFFMVKGRTGHVILLVLFILFGWTTLVQIYQRRGKIFSLKHTIVPGLVALSTIILIYNLSPMLQQRVHASISDIQSWQPKAANRTDVGARLDYYYDTLQIIQKHPVLGVGTGGFTAAFAQHIQGTDRISTYSAHNEYLMITVQTGVIGLVMLLYLFYTQWRYAPQLENLFYQDAARGLVLAYMVNCMFNSALLDHTDGLFFAFMTALLFANYSKDKQDG